MTKHVPMPAVPPALLVIGPPHHGVVRYALDLADAISAERPRPTVIVVPDADAAATTVREIARAHLHVTDRLLGRDPEEAATHVERLAALTSLTLTVHDLPQTSDGTMYERRVAAYRRLINAADAVVVNSRHEAQLVVEHLGLPAASVTVIHLGSSGRAPERTTVADNPPGTLIALIAGYIYPGKGHREVLDAIASALNRLRDDGARVDGARVVAIGGPSPGHEHDVDELHGRAHELGVDLIVTGTLSNDDYRMLVGGEGIPVAAHQHISASRSMLDWVESGRRPLVRASRYATEMAELRPGTLSLYEPLLLADALMESWQSPASTRISATASLRPTLADAAISYRDWWATVAQR